MPRPVVSLEPAADRLRLTAAQEAAVAKLAYAVGHPNTIALLCGPAGVGKTTVLRAIAADEMLQPRTVRSISWADVRADQGELPGSRVREGERGEEPVPTVLIVDDAHRAFAHELAVAVDRWRRRHDGIAIVLAGEGRLLSLVAGDHALEQAVRLRATLPPFTLAESRRLLAAMPPFDAPGPQHEEVIRTIHEIAGGVPAIALRLADMAMVLAGADPGHRLTPHDVETIHRRLCLTAA